MRSGSFTYVAVKALIVSASVVHLQKLMALAAELGVPRERMGQYTAFVHGPEA